MKIDSHIVISCLAVLTAQSGITLYLPSLPSIVENFHASPGFSALTLSAFLAGMGLPMLLWGRVAALLGGRATMIWALLLFSISSLGVALSADTGMFIICRTVQGAAAGGISVMARVLLRDNFSAQHLAKALSWLSICFVISLGLAQFAGALIHTAWGWRAVFFTSAALGFLLIFPVMRYTPSGAPDRRASSPGRKIYGTLIRDVQFMRPVLAGGLGYGVIILFGASAPALFQLRFNWTSVEYGWMGWPVSGAYMLGALSVGWLLLKRSQDQSLMLGLKLLALGALLMGAGQFLFPATGSALWLSYCLLLFGQGIVYPLCQSLANQSTSVSGPYAMALTGFIHQAIAACCGLIAGVLPPGQLGPFTLVCIVLATLALCIYCAGRVKAPHK
ncbi:MFS transporter [Pseudomonas cichorii]|uniref:MFS transporter n=1 Tax=Pseudomonas cichorii TaxID=36746 RepID=UPI001C898E02|nr:MFS transporter [Pseudomonas cichorii]MBX8516978.1 MFS transporter [Pseudomonas cichorii]